MSNITARFIGSGDAFGSGGRLQTCILIDALGIRFALDFGTSSLIGLRQQHIDPNSVDMILLSHLHGDHCGGIPFLLLDAMLGSKRTKPLTILGPANTQTHLLRLQEALFPGSDVMAPRFALDYKTIAPDKTLTISNFVITAADACHTLETKPLALRIQIGDKAIVYTGDGEYTEALRTLVFDVDLLIAECYFYSKSVKWHLNYSDIGRLSAKRIVLTHMHADMLARINEVPEQCAHDGYELTI